MIRKAKQGTEGEAGAGVTTHRKRRRSRKSDPLDVRLTVRFNFGDETDDHVTVMDQRSVPMVGGLIANRDRIMRGFISLMLRTAMKQPRVARELLPVLRPPRAGKPSR
jgi:hypothetical protein